MDSAPAGSQIGRPPQGGATDPARPGAAATRLGAGLEWRRSHAPVPYDHAIRVMERRAAAIVAGQSHELVWLLEHPPLVTAGTSARDTDLLDPARFPVHRTGRGGQFTYHGPGQRVAYAVLDLERRRRDLRLYVHTLEEWVIRTLAAFGVQGLRREGRVGIWVVLAGGGEAKIGAIGVRVRRWVAYHGIALNVAPELEHFSAIVPCGISEHGVTSLAALGIDATMADVDRELKKTFEDILAAPHGRP